MELKLSLGLPRDEVSVPVVRRVLRASLLALGVRDDVVSDIELALTEACTNVLDHADGEAEYEVSAGIDGQTCVIEVSDRGAGFTSDDLGMEDASSESESGRGIQIMRAVVDKVEFARQLADGSVVRLEKALEWDDDSAVRRLSGQPVEHGPWSSGEHLADVPRRA